MTKYLKLNVFALMILSGGYAFGAFISSGTCTFNGVVMQNDSLVTAYQNSSVPAGQTCVSESRHCVDGVLYGSYAYSSCSPSPYASCLFNGQTIAHGGSVTGYTSSTVAYGLSCTSVAEMRTCNNGVLSGSAQYSSCDANAPRACLFNGMTVAHAATVTAFQASTSQFGGSCISEPRTCNDGTLSGSYQYGACNIDQPASCLFDGRTIAHGENVAAFPTSSVSYGQTCVAETRSCYNGFLSGSNQFSSCSVGSAASCTFDGKTLISGGSVTAFASSSVPYGGVCQSEARSCSNGNLSGSYSSSSCVVASPLSCSFNGQPVAHDASILAYSSSSVIFGGTCQSEMRSCSNGNLSGSFVNGACQVSAPVDCSINGAIVKHGSSSTLFFAASVPFGQTCQSEVRTCYNGSLSGTAAQSTCVVENAPPAKSCILNGKTILSGAAVTTYQSANVAFGQSCVSQSRMCNDGILSGSYSSESCVVDPAIYCKFNGQTVLHGASVVAYSSSTSSTTCVSETRTCDNGALSGSFTQASCSVVLPKSCILNGKTIASGASVSLFTTSSVPYGQVCQSEQRQCLDGQLSGSAVSESCVVDPKPVVSSCEMSKIIWEFAVRTSKGSGQMIFGSLTSRLSRDGGKTWVFIDHRNLPQDLKEIYKYIVKSRRIDGMNRPLNFMVDSKNKGYLVIRTEFLPSCDACGFKEFKAHKANHHACQNKEHHKKHIKFVCKKQKGDKDKDDDEDEDDDDRSEALRKLFKGH